MSSKKPEQIADTFDVRPETIQDDTGVDALVMSVFGPGMFARAAYALRENTPHERTLSFVAWKGTQLVGSVRVTRVNWGDRPALMLGPLGVLESEKSRGVGRALMGAAVDAARAEAMTGGPTVMILVGDLDYYARFGFARIPADRIRLPRPADPARVLMCELVEGAGGGFSGVATRWN